MTVFERLWTGRGEFRLSRVGAGLLVVGLVLAASAGCADDEVDSVGDAPGETGRVEYRSVSVIEDGRVRDLVAGTVIALWFDQGRVGASLGCNSMTGTFELDGGSLVIEGGMATTEMGCEAPLHEQDEWFAALLGSRPTLRVEGTELVLADGSTTATFVERSVVDPHRPLEGTRWEVTGFVDGEVASSGYVTDQVAHLVLEGGTATGSDGCNDFSMPYELDGDELALGPAVVTDVACSNDVEYQERVHAGLFEKALRWEVSHDSLLLVDADGLGLTLRAASD